MPPNTPPPPQQAASLEQALALALAVAQHQAGQLAEAEKRYREILQTHPNHPETNHNMGVLALQMKRPADGLPYLMAALEADPARAQYWLSYIDALIQADQPETAREVLALARRQGLQGDEAEALVLRLNSAEASCLQAAQIDTATAAVHYNRGNTLKQAGRLNEAEVNYRRALQVNPHLAEAHNNLGLTLQTLGRLEESETSFRRALQIRPDLAEAYGNLGNTLKGQGRLDEAESSYRRALQLDPENAMAHYNLGIDLHDMGRLDEAEASYRQAIKFNPDFATAHNNLGLTLMALGRLDEAEACLARALQINPNDTDARCNLGATFMARGRLDEAEACYRRALEIKPDYAKALSNLGVALQDMGQLDEAVACYRRALAIDPDFTDAHGNLLFALNYHPDLSAEEIYRAYREYDALRGIPLRSTWRAHGNDRNPDRRLRVGYVSPDFRHHSCKPFLEPLLAHHDKTQVEVYAYAELLKEDDLTARYRACVEHWIPTRGMTNEALAERIRSDGIDILVELAGHTAGNRLLAFARKPAPVSLSWLGYGYTTGLSAMDYYLTDDTIAPKGSEGLFSETPWRIATPAYNYRPNAGMGEVNLLPAQQRGYVTFGTLTRSIRVNHRTIRVWAEILKAVPNSRLVLDSLTFKDPAMQARMAARFALHGITAERLEIGFHSPPWDVLRGIDIGLDGFPHNSGTTLFETLYMGVPYITLAARPSVGRLGSSILQGAGHAEWIATSEDDYVARAVGLASDLAGLSNTRSILRTQMENSPLRDEAGFARKVEQAYRSMWKIWCGKDDNIQNVRVST